MKNCLRTVRKVQGKTTNWPESKSTIVGRKLSMYEIIRCRSVKKALSSRKCAECWLAIQGLQTNARRSQETFLEIEWSVLK
jgi:hypothetical protein